VRRLLSSWAAALAVAVAVATWPALAQDEEPQPSFDCDAATAPIEALICGDAALADLDQTLANSYHAALATRVGEAQLLLREEQRAWSRNRTATCGVADDAAADPTPDPTAAADAAIGCLVALYRARIAELQPGTGGGNTASPSGYGWLMGDWTVAAVRTPPGDAARAAAAKAQLGRTLRLAEASITTLGGAVCSSPRYSAEPAPSSAFGDLSDFPVAVMVRLSCVGIALLDVVRLTDETILIGEGGAVFELERRR
jgi:uncharacterized protein YecT (DUF1311 family)